MLTIRNLKFSYPGKEEILLDNLDLDLRPGEITAITGNSGTGKTTLLRIVAGLETPQGGEIYLDERPLLSADRGSVPPEKRGISLMFQDLALFPHLTVWENARFGARDTPETETMVLLALTDLKVLRDRYPHQLSGGQRQRLALVRALSGRPGYILLDEPFNNLDRRLIETLCREFRNLMKARGVGALVVTHEKDQAYLLADRIGFLEKGQIVQLAEPEIFYHRPLTLGAARFGGPLNLVNLITSSLGRRLALGLTDVPTGTEWMALRPEHLAVSREPGAPAPSFPVEILGSRFQGRDWVLQVRWPEGDLWEVYSDHPMASGPGWVRWQATHGVFLKH